MSSRTEWTVEGRALPVSNLDRVLWRAPPFTKADLLAYYRDVAPVLLPHIARRPMTMARFPEGVLARGWYQLNCRAPEWVPQLSVAAQSGPPLRLCLVNDLATLLWVANQGTIELHPYYWTADAAEDATDVIFDLDPGAPAALGECAQVALLLRERLEARGLCARVKTSGRLGLHVSVPLLPGHTFAQTKAFARALAAELAQGHPEHITDRQARGERAGRVYIDWLQNDRARSTIAPYSLRAMPTPGVSMPVTWEEVAACGAGTLALGFSPEDVATRLERHGDLWVASGQRLTD